MIYVCVFLFREASPSVLPFDSLLTHMVRRTQSAGWQGRLGGGDGCRMVGRVLFGLVTSCPRGSQHSSDRPWRCLVEREL